jgi:hypothetical protein
MAAKARPMSKRLQSARPGVVDFGTFSALFGSLSGGEHIGVPVARGAPAVLVAHAIRRPVLGAELRPIVRRVVRAAHPPPRPVTRLSGAPRTIRVPMRTRGAVPRRKLRLTHVSRRTGPRPLHPPEIPLRRITRPASSLRVREDAQTALIHGDDVIRHVRTAIANTRILDFAAVARPPQRLIRNPLPLSAVGTIRSMLRRIKLNRLPSRPFRGHNRLLSLRLKALWEDAPKYDGKGGIWRVASKPGSRSVRHSQDSPAETTTALSFNCSAQAPISPHKMTAARASAAHRTAHQCASEHRRCVGRLPMHGEAPAPCVLSRRPWS